jgi:hypothetical protein
MIHHRHVPTIILGTLAALMLSVLVTGCMSPGDWDQGVAEAQAMHEQVTVWKAEIEAQLQDARQFADDLAASLADARFEAFKLEGEEASDAADAIAEMESAVQRAGETIAGLEAQLAAADEHLVTAEQILHEAEADSSPAGQADTWLALASAVAGAFGLTTVATGVTAVRKAGVARAIVQSIEGAKTSARKDAEIKLNAEKLREMQEMLGVRKTVKRIRDAA